MDYELEPKIPETTTFDIFMVALCLGLFIKAACPFVAQLSFVIQFCLGLYLGFLVAEIYNYPNRLYYIFNWKEHIKWKTWY